MTQIPTGYTVYHQAGEEFPVRVTFRRPDGLSAEPRQFRTEEDAERWIREMEALERAGSGE